MKYTPVPPVSKLPSSSLQEPEGQFVMARRLQVPIWIYDVDNNRVLHANQSACDLWQAKSEAELQERNFGADMSPTVLNRLKQYQAAFLERDAEFTEQWTLYPNGTPKSVLIIYRGYLTQDGRMAMQCEAVSEAVQTPQNLRSAEALLYTDVKITLFSREGPPLYMNPAAQSVFPSNLRNFADLIVDPNVHQKLLSQVDVLGEFSIVTKVKTLEGTRWFDLTGKKCIDAVTGKPAILLTAFDVSELKEARDTAYRLANHDQLTDLHNRAYLQHFYEALVERQDTEEYAAVFFDVDRFKLINDRHGHAAGDTVLQHIARQCRAIIGVDDLVARIGGDEFVIIMSGTRKRAALDARIADLRLAISRPILHNQTLVDVEISIGVATFSPRLSSFESVLRKADLALYASKENGRNQVTFFTEEMGAASRTREQIEVELKHAVKHNEFTLFYQPRLDIASNKIIGAEGLVRWNHPMRGLIMPNDFIPICEETGLIDELGRLVLELGCRQAIAWHEAGLELEISLNVSPRQFNDRALLGTLEYFAKLPNFPVGKVELEITENALIGDHNAIADKLRIISALGFSIAIDDFGSGYSNLSYISRFPLSCLKIDRSFIEQLPQSGPIVRLILTLGQQLGATVVSEGIETHEQLRWLHQNDCNQAQGYLIARPLPLEDFLDFFKGYDKEMQPTA